MSFNNMNISGTINVVNSSEVNGTASVTRCNYDNVLKTVLFTVKTQPVSGPSACVTVSLKGDEVTALGSNWSDDDLINAACTKYGLSKS